MFKKGFGIPVIVSLVVLLAFSSIGMAKGIQVGLAISTLNNPFFVDLKNGAENEAGKLGMELIIVDAQDDAARQLNSIEDLIMKRVDVLIINPVDGDSIIAAIELANQAKIPVITVDRGANGGEVVSHIASDNVAGGEMAAEFVASKLNQTGKVVELQGIAGTSAARDRGAGFHHGLKNYPQIEVIASQPADFNLAKGMTVMENILQAHRKIDAVFAHNDSMALGAIEAIAAAGRTKEIMIVGFDAIADAIKAVQAGKLAATIAQKPVLMGELAVQTAQQILNGAKVAAYVPVPLKLVVD